MQQSVAFKILRTRLKTVPPYSFSGEQFRRPSQGNTFSDVNYVGGSEDGEMSADIRNVQNGINFASWLHQFEQVQQQHRSHTKSQALSRCSSVSSTKVCYTLFFSPLCSLISNLLLGLCL